MPDKRVLSTPKRSVSELPIALVVLGCIILIATFFFMRGRTALERELQERLKGIASVASLQFTAEEVLTLRTAEDISKPEWKTVVSRLNAVRQASADVVFAYILRTTLEGEHPVVFVADADSVDPSAEKDINGDGFIDDADHLAPPGDPYEDAPLNMILRGYEGPIASDEPYMDQWGTLVSGYAPIRDRDGKAVAVLAIDIRSDDYRRTVDSMFSPTAFSIIFVAGALLASGVAYLASRHRKHFLRRLNLERLGLMQLSLQLLGCPLTIL